MYLERNKRRKPVLREAATSFVDEFVRQHPCVHYSEDDPVVLECNHIDPVSKCANISDMIRAGASVRRLLAEITKCGVMCVKIATNGRQHGALQDCPIYGSVGGPAG